MLLNLLLLAGGLALLVFGGDWLVRGASALARRFGVGEVVIGLTVVAFGTSAPELVVSFAAALDGAGGIAFGNVVGSNIANIGLLLGLTVLIRPLTVHRTLIVREIPMLILASAVGLALGLDGAGFSRGDGVVLLLLFCVFGYYTVLDVVRSEDDRKLLAEEIAEPGVRSEGSAGAAPAEGLGRAILFVLVGLVALVVGGQMAVTSATRLAEAMGVPQVVIGLTIVAVGTSLPELVTCLVAARRGQSDIAVGNIVGSNLFNLMFVWGLTATVSPTALPAGGGVDLAVALGMAVLLLPLAVTDTFQIRRWEGAVLLVAWLAFALFAASRG